MIKKTKLNKTEKKLKRREYLKQKISAWGVGGSDSREPRLSVPPTPPEQGASQQPAGASADASVSSVQWPTNAVAILPQGKAPLTDRELLSALQELYYDISNIDKAAAWLEFYMPKVLARTSGELEVYRTELKVKLAELIIACTK